jgi:hypothetical protein
MHEFEAKSETTPNVVQPYVLRAGRWTRYCFHRVVLLSQRWADLHDRFRPLLSGPAIYHCLISAH